MSVVWKNTGPWVKWGCLFIVLCVLAIGVLTLSNPQAPELTAAAPRNVSETLVPALRPGISERPAATPAPAPVSSSVQPVSTPTPPIATESAPALERRYFAAATTPEERLEIIADLGALEAGEALGRIFRDERRWETKMKVLEVAGDLDSDRQHEQKLALLKAALAPNQNRVIREAALSDLASIDDPRAAALVDATARGSDKELREAAQAIREARAAPPQ